MEEKKPLNFIEEIVEEDLKQGTHGGRVLTRFPPEPNGYLHIGHSKAICLNFGLAQKYGGKTNLRFDDTNPSTEDTEYVDSIRNDIQWLGFKWDAEYYASDYFGQLYEWALVLIDKGLAYVDDSTPEEIAALKGTPTSPGTNSPYRDRSVEENRRLFVEMKEGKHSDGSRILRAKIDMTHPNMILRDPVLYRIKRVAHHRTGNDWCIYPMYDFAHGQSDSIEKITHSICTLEFVPHRALYDWCIENLEIFPSRQYEFARLNLTYTIMSKRKLLELVNGGHVKSWDDPRMPTISGLRRRGFTPESIREFATRVGVAKRENIIEVQLLEYCVREDLNKKAHRVMAVTDPIKLIISNYPEGKTETLLIENNPEAPENGTREVPFSRELYIEKEDFMENPPKKYFRLYPGGMVRLKGAYIIVCNEVIKDDNGNIIAVHASYIENSRSGNDNSGLSVKGTIHWVSIPHAAVAEVRLYDRLFTDPNPGGHDDKDFKDFINPDSLKIVSAYIEPALRNAKLGESYQFIRKAYFCLDLDTRPEHLVFNQTVTLKDSWNPSKG